jgi:hypothetical protein
MKLEQLYKHKLCPSKSGYTCDDIRCAKFISCMMNEIDALYVIGGINNVDTNELNAELLQMVVSNAHDNCR